MSPLTPPPLTKKLALALALVTGLAACGPASPPAGGTDAAPAPSDKAGTDRHAPKPPGDDA